MVSIWAHLGAISVIAKILEYLINDKFNKYVKKCNNLPLNTTLGGHHSPIEHELGGQPLSHEHDSWAVKRPSQR